MGGGHGLGRGHGVPDLQVEIAHAQLLEAGQARRQRAARGRGHGHAAQLAGLHLGHGQCGRQHGQLQVAALDGVEHLRVAGIGNVLGPERGAALEQLHAQVAHGAHAGRAVAPAAAGLGSGLQEGPALGRAGRRHQHQGRHADQADGLQVLDGVVAHGGVEQAGNRQVAVDHHAEGMAIARTGHLLACNVAACAHLVLDDDGLAQALFQRLGQCARREVRGRSCGKADDQVQRLAGPVVARHGSARQQGRSQGGGQGIGEEAA